jgi:hypothetical protein
VWQGDVFYGINTENVQVGLHSPLPVSLDWLHVHGPYRLSTQFLRRSRECFFGVKFNVFLCCKRENTMASEEKSSYGERGQQFAKHSQAG